MKTFEIMVKRTEANVALADQGQAGAQATVDVDPDKGHAAFCLLEWIVPGLDWSSRQVLER